MKIPELSLIFCSQLCIWKVKVPSFGSKGPREEEDMLGHPAETVFRQWRTADVDPLGREASGSSSEFMPLALIRGLDFVQNDSQANVIASLNLCFYHAHWLKTACDSTMQRFFISAVWSEKDWQIIATSGKWDRHRLQACAVQCRSAGALVLFSPGTEEKDRRKEVGRWFFGPRT